ncbi:hypothetical protein H6P81_011292 [Aristolochia fimbriata]|uniref:DYW domain-containing protein n=1 Tax=Aristolochia fimbriata TaxID=158543 RepID=A0AAV7ER28_ARIFI|nr:hypothetical protein H6P81_011292 [Aristolochia fimbriata]
MKEAQLLGAGKKMEQASGSKRVEDSHGKSCSNVGCGRSEKLVDGGIDHLMILAQSAELVEADHQSREDGLHGDQQPASGLFEDFTISGKDTARQHRRTRLTQIRHYARTKHAHMAERLLIKSSTDKSDFPKFEMVYPQEIEKDSKDLHYEVSTTSTCGMVNEKKVHRPNKVFDSSFDTGPTSPTAKHRGSWKSAQRGKEQLRQIDEQQLHKRKHLHDTMSTRQLDVNGEGRRGPPQIYPPYFQWCVSDRAQVLKEKQRFARQVRIQRRQKEKNQETLPTEAEIATVHTEKKRLRPIAPRLFCHKDYFIAHQIEQQTALELSKGFQGEHIVAHGHTKHVAADQQSRDKKQHIAQLGERLLSKQMSSKNSHNGLNSSPEIAQDSHIGQEQNPLRVKGVVRLTQLRCQARVKYVAEKGKVLLKSNGRTKLRMLRIIRAVFHYFGRVGCITRNETVGNRDMRCAFYLLPNPDAHTMTASTLPSTPPHHLKSKPSGTSNLQLQSSSPPPLLLLPRCASLRELKQIQATVVKAQLQHDAATLTKLITWCARNPASAMDHAQLLFGEIAQPDLVLFNTMYKGYARTNRPIRAVALFGKMLQLGLFPDDYTFPSLIKACTGAKALEEGKQVHSLVVRLGLQQNVYVCPTLINLYAECEEVNGARRLFDQMETRCVVSYNAMITGYAKSSRPNEALALFRELQARDVKPTDVTMLSVLSCCAMLGALELGKWVHEYIQKHGFDKYVKVNTALIDMYAKCGSLENAISIFEEMDFRDTQAWSAMIVAYAIHGHGSKAISLFEEMTRARIRPDSITFLGLLYACSHNGLVEEGRLYFHSMRDHHGLVPSVKHYGCMVDLLGRAGLLDEAYQFIRGLPIKPTAILWRTLLSACSVHGNAEMGKRVIKRIFELEDSHGGDYVILSNMCAVDGQWQEVINIRKLMRVRGVAKVPGCSSIEVDNVVHEFFAGDGTHPQSVEMHRMLDVLVKQLKLVGYVPNTSLVFHPDMTEEMKEVSLRYHSEKLAIAFGLINTPPGTTIRVVKNLRVCADCHSAAKLISMIFNREIVLRDLNRFHHFKDGSCSCEMSVVAPHNFQLHLSFVSLLCRNPVLILQRSVQCLRFFHPLEAQAYQPKQPSNQSENFCVDEREIVDQIQSCISKTCLKQIHARLIRTCFIQGTAVLMKFLSQSLKLDMDYSSRVLSQTSEPSMSLCNTILKEYSHGASPEDAFNLYKLMKRQGIGPSPFSASFVIKACNYMQSVVGARQMHAAIIRDGHQHDSLLLTSLMSLYASSGSGEEACLLFEEIPCRDTIAWNVLISCYTRNRRTRDALGVFEAMQAPPNGCQPDDVTCLLTIQACSHLGALMFGDQIQSYIIKQGYANHLQLCNSLIDMYSKCGCLDEAYRVFKETDTRNVVTWSAMISGLAMNGHGKEAITAFKEMLEMGVMPDEQTFTAVLSACSHCALVHEGIGYFDLMRSEFGIVPNIHHYGCMVDLLGRAGLLERAYSLIRSMVIKPDATIWRTLLGACRIHGHVALGERVVGHLIELKAQEAGDYVLLINIYASAGNWEKVAEVRRLMKDRRIQTEPGCSTIDVKGKIHEFVVDDDNHPRKKEIYKMLVEIESQLKIAGYVANVAAELHKAEIEQKESALSYHSEKLAMAFGILATPPGTTLRIAKNLRTCVDCHTFAKVLSSVYNRLVIVRDRTRFHHFRDGSCSCNDYW